MMRMMPWIVVLSVVPVVAAQNPLIPAGQTRVIEDTALTDDYVGEALYADDFVDSWIIVAEDNSQVPGVSPSERFFNIDSRGQISVARALTAFFAPDDGVNSRAVTLTVRAYFTLKDPEDAQVEIVVVRGLVIPAGQTRTVDAEAYVGDEVGSALYSSGDPESWTIVTEVNPEIAGIDVNEVFFGINGYGEIEVARSLTPFFPSGDETASRSITLTVRVFSGAASSADTEVEVIVIRSQRLPVITPAQTFATTNTTETEVSVGEVYATGDPDIWNVVEEINWVDESVEFAGEVGSNERFFAIDSRGEIIIMQDLNRFFPQRFVRSPQIMVTLIVRAFNDSGPSDEEAVQIYIVDVTPRQDTGCNATHAGLGLKQGRWDGMGDLMTFGVALLALLLAAVFPGEKRRHLPGR